MPRQAPEFHGAHRRVCVAHCGSEQTCDTPVTPVSCRVSGFTAPTVQVLPFRPPLPQLPTTPVFFFCCLHGFASFRASYSWDHTTCSLLRPASFTWFLLVFSWLDSSFLFSVNGLPLPGRMSRFIHLPKGGALVASRFWRLRTKPRRTSLTVQVLIWTQVSTPWGQYQGV